MISASLFDAFSTESLGGACSGVFLLDLHPARIVMQAMSMTLDILMAAKCMVQGFKTLIALQQVSTD